MSVTMIIAGFGLAAVSFGARYILRQMPKYSETMTNAMKSMPKFDSKTLANSKYYKGGFENKMTKREAGLILGIPSTSHQTKVKAAYKRIILINHPDKGGSPYIAAKITEAKDILDK